MNKKTKKFFVLKNLKEQSADNGNGKNRQESAVCCDVLDEAEKIVDKYMENLGYTRRRRKKKGIYTFMVNTIVLGGIIYATYMLKKLF